jgi:diguanylate cyclase (GGDEF)-like protein
VGASIDAVSLGDFAVLAGVSLATRMQLAQDARAQQVVPGHRLIQQGAPNQAMYLILEGTLDVSLDGVAEPIARLGHGETVGELSLLDRSLASASVTALKESRVLVVEEEAFWALINASHAFAVNLLIRMAERLRANNAAVSWNVTRRQRYEQAAMFDGLTGIHNRRWLDEALARLVGRSSGGGVDLSVSLLDIDHFKRFNDEHGHDAGDVVLSAVAAALARNLRPTDLVARYGGEEFVLLFPDTSLAEACIAADRVRLAIQRLEVRRQDGRLLPPVTVSMGVAQLTPDDSAPSLLKAADEALYQAKREGRNRVIAAEREGVLTETSGPQGGSGVDRCRGPHAD